MVWMCCHWTEAFPCRQASVSSVAKVLSEKIILSSRATLNHESGRGTHVPLGFDKSMWFDRVYTSIALTALNPQV